MALSRAKVEAAVANARHRSSDGWLRGKCPFCVQRTGKEDKRGAFGFNALTGFVSCFKCGVKGRVEGFENAPTRAPTEEKHLDDPSAFKAPESFTSLTSPEGRESYTFEPARTYCQQRGIGPALWQAAHIGACWRGRYAGRVVFPILDRGDWVGFVARLHRKAEEGEPTYLYPPWMKRSETLYNREALWRETDEPVLVVEGVIDALAYWPDAVALFGKVSDSQLIALSCANRPVAVVMDGDAHIEGLQLALKLKIEGQRAGHVVLPPLKDPDEVDKTWLREEARNCIE